MTEFISTQTSKYLSVESTADVIPIYTLSSTKLDDWLETLSKCQCKWAKQNNFKAAKDEVLKLPADDGGLSAIILGLGSTTAVSGIEGFATLAKSLPEGHYKLINQADHKLYSIGWSLAQYEFDHYQEEKNRHNAVLVVKDEQQLKEISTIVNGITLIRDLVNTPTCDMGPSHLSTVMADLSDQFKGVFTEIVGDELLSKGLNTIHAVGRAAKDQPRLLEMFWGREDAPKLTLIGKGVCFDTGGLDLKPSSGMRFMKKDMGGAAHTLGLAQMIMTMNIDVRLHLLIPAVENNIAGDAFRPGDIIKTYQGTTVEVDNTDAEGRLVLCDALALAAEENPDLLIDFATLTGAARVAMGTDIVPFFTQSDQLAQDLTTFAEKENDPIWRLPLYAPYSKQLKSSYADLRNMGSGPFGGAIIAALFLKHFVKEPHKWLHFDVFAWNMSESSTCPEGGEAMAIRSLFSYLQDRFGN